MSNRTVWFLATFVGAAVPLLFFVGTPSAPSANLLAQVGIAVGIAPNPYNTLNDQLQAEKAQIDKQAADLAAREAAFASSTASSSSTSASSVVWYLSAAVILIGLLVCLNFYLDWRLFQRTRNASEVVDLKE